MMAAGVAGLLAVAAPVRAEDETIEHRTQESTHVRTDPAPVVHEHERVIERQAAPAAVERRSKETVVHKGTQDDNDNDDND